MLARGGVRVGWGSSSTTPPSVLIRACRGTSDESELMKLQRAGLWSDRNDPGKDLGALRALGYEWIVFQVQNEDNPVTDRREGMALARSKGLTPGAWGVSTSRLGDHTLIAADQAKVQGAEVLWMNVERPITANEAVSMVAAGKLFPGEKGLVTLTAYIESVNPKIFTEAGWQIAHEAYLSDQPTTTPVEGEMRRSRAGFSQSQFSHVLSMYRGANGLPTGEEYANRLRNAGAQNRFSCWMVEQEFDDYAALARGAITPEAPVPEPTPDPYPWNEFRDLAKDDLRKAVAVMRQKGLSTTVINRSRIGIALDVLESTDAELATYRRKLGL